MVLNYSQIKAYNNYKIVFLSLWQKTNGIQSLLLIMQMFGSNAQKMMGDHVEMWILEDHFDSTKF